MSPGQIIVLDWAAQSIHKCQGASSQKADPRTLVVFLFFLCYKTLKIMNYLEDFIFKPIRKKFNIRKLHIFVFIVRIFLAVMKCVLFLFKSNLESCGISYDGL